MKVCLIGNNLTSLILAYILSKKNFYSEIYSIKSSKSNFKTRTLGLADNNLKFLEKYLSKLSQKTNPIKTINVFVKNRKDNEKISFNSNSEILFHMIKYDKIISFVKSKIKSSKYICHRYLKKNSDLVSLINNKKFQLIINCEKQNILTKKFLKKEIKKNYNNKAFTTIIKHSKIKDNNTATQIFSDYGPIAFLPLSQNLTSVVFSFDIKKKEKISKIEILDLIKYFNPTYKIISSEIPESFNLNLNLPKNYFYKNILFFGDSIHSIHPLAGQGFNMTIRDMINLIKIIDEKVNLGLTLDKSMFKEFENKTKSYNAIFSFGIDFIHEFFKFNKNSIPKNISKKIFTFINNTPRIKKLGINLANQ